MLQLVSIYIDKNVKIGANVKIQNGVSVYDGVCNESDVLLVQMLPLLTINTQSK